MKEDRSNKYLVNQHLNMTVALNGFVHLVTFSGAVVDSP